MGTSPWSYSLSLAGAVERQLVNRNDFEGYRLVASLSSAQSLLRLLERIREQVGSVFRPPLISLAPLLKLVRIMGSDHYSSVEVTGNCDSVNHSK